MKKLLTICGFIIVISLWWITPGQPYTATLPRGPSATIDTVTIAAGDYLDVSNAEFDTLSVGGTIIVGFSLGVSSGDRVFFAHTRIGSLSVSDSLTIYGPAEFLTLPVFTSGASSQDVLDMEGNDIQLSADGDDYIHSPSDDNIALAIAGSDEVQVSASTLFPATSDGSALGSTSKMWADLFLASGGVINFNNGDITLTHSAGKLTWGGDGAVEIDYANHEQTNVDINSGAIDGTAIGANSPNTGAFTTLSASGNSSFTGTSMTVSATANFSDGLTAANVDIAAGEIDGTTLGANSPSTAAVTTLNVSGAAVIGDGADAVTLNASKTMVKGPFVIGRTDTTVTGLSVKKFHAFDLHDPNQLGKLVPDGNGGRKLISMYDEYRQIESSTSIVEQEGIRHPDYGVGVITTAADSLVIVDGADQSQAIAFRSLPNYMIPTNLSSLYYLDGMWYVGSTVSRLSVVDFLEDRSIRYYNQGIYVHTGDISQRNTATSTSQFTSSPQIVNAAVNAVSAIRSPWPFHVDAFGRQLPYWAVGTAGGVSVSSYDQGRTLSIYDDTFGTVTKDVSLDSRGTLVFIRDIGVSDRISIKPNIQAITGDAWTIAQTSGEELGIATSGYKGFGLTQTNDFSVVALAPHRGENNSPTIWAGSDAGGLYIINPKFVSTSPSSAGYKWRITSTFSSSLQYGNVMAAFSPASTASIAGISAIFSTAETAVTRSATTDGPNSHSWSFNGTTSVSRVADHDSLSIFDGTSDTPFSIMVWVNLEGVASNAAVIVAKENSTSGSEAKEYELSLDGSGLPTFVIYDNSVPAWIGRKFGTTFPSSGWHLLVATYDGGGTNASCKIYLDVIQVDNTNVSGGSYVASENLGANLTIGARIGNGGNYISLFDGLMTPPIITREVIPQSVIEAEYRRGLEAIQSPTNDLLPTLAVKSIDVDKSGQHVLVTSANEATLMSATGAVQDTFKCTGCGTLADGVFGPQSVGDSLEIYLGGSTGYRKVGNEVSVEALAAREYQDRSVSFGQTSVTVDSAGYGDFWNMSDAQAALQVQSLGTKRNIVHASNPDSSVFRADSVHVKTAIVHASDGDTKIAFGTGDTATVVVGNETMLGLYENGTQDIVELGDDGDVDIKLSGGADGALFVEGSSGNVGIGTTAPDKGLLDVRTMGVAQFTGLHMGHSNLRNVQDDEVSIDFSTYNDGVMLGRISGWNQNSASNHGGLKFYGATSASINANPTMTMTYNGNVGIGMTLPQAKLHVEKTQATYNLNETIIQGSISGGGGEPSFTVAVTGDALGTTVGSNFDYAADVLSQENVARSSGFLSISNGTTAAQTSTFSFLGLVPGSTTPVSRLRIDPTGNVGIGTMNFGTNAATVLGLANGTAPTSSPANMVQLWAADVSSSSELQVRDEAGNVTVLSANVESYPATILPSVEFPYVEKQSNVYAGVETYVAMHKMAELVEALAHQQGLLPLDKKIIEHVAIPKEDRAREDSLWMAKQYADSTKAVQKKMAVKAEFDSLQAVKESRIAAYPIIQAKRDSLAVVADSIRAVVDSLRGLYNIEMVPDSLRVYPEIPVLPVLPDTSIALPDTNVTIPKVIPLRPLPQWIRGKIAK